MELWLAEEGQKEGKGRLTRQLKSVLLMKSNDSQNLLPHGLCL